MLSMNVKNVVDTMIVLVVVATMSAVKVDSTMIKFIVGSTIDLGKAQETISLINVSDEAD